MDIQYSLIRSKKRKKTISLQIGRNSEVRVYAPYHTPVGEIHQFVEEKRNWISKMARRQSQQPALIEAKSFITGEYFYYLGQRYPLEVFFEPLENEGVVFWNNRFFLNCPENPEMKKHYFVVWYKKKARQYFGERVAFYADVLKLTADGLRITSAGSRWGSCSHDNQLAFSFRLIMALPAVIDYVVVHELAHFRQKNHSSKFWDLVVEVIPDYKAHRRWLRDHQDHFHL